MKSLARVPPILYPCIFLSGAAALANEVLWTRILGITFGHTVYALTTVLVAFMSGIALGSYLLGKMADRVPNPLRFYAFLEVGIGLYCLATPWILDRVREAYLHLAPSLPEDPLALTLVRFGLVFPVLLVPTTLMGGTLPAFLRFLVRSPSDTGRSVGLAYGLNTLGAAAGTLAVGYWLIPSLGIRATNRVGVVACALAAAGALLAAGEVPSPLPRDSRGPVNRDPADPGNGSRVLLWAFAVSGAVGMALEIAWTRTLVLVIGSSTYAFSAILFTFLVGIGGGSLLFSRLKARVSLPLFGLLLTGISLGGALLIPAFNLLPGIFLALFKGLGGNFSGFLFVQLLVVFLVLLPPTLLAGMTFPCASALINRNAGSTGSSLGRLYAWNTCGAIVGSLLAGFVLVPLLGSQKTIAVGVAAAALAGIVVVWNSDVRWSKSPAAILTALCLFVSFAPGWDRRLLSSGVFYAGGAFRSISGLVDDRFLEVLYFREGTSSTVSVAHFRSGVTGLLVNGKVDANNGADMETQVKLGQLPLMLHPDPRRVAVIGLGSGVTAGIATLYESPSSIDVLEIEPAVVEAARFFSRENFGALEDPRIRLHLGDARSFLDIAPPGYDVIISEPSNPWMAGVGNLFSREFFRKARENLAPGGIYCQWVQGYSITPEAFRLVARTFLEAFPETTVWMGTPSDFILIGFRDVPPRIDSETLRRRIERNPRLLRSYRFLGDSPADSLLFSFFLDSEGFREYAGTGLLHTDDFPLLEFEAARSLYLPDRSVELRRGMLDMRRQPYPDFFYDREYLDRESHLRLAGHLGRRGRTDEADIHLRAASESTARNSAGTVRKP